MACWTFLTVLMLPHMAASQTVITVAVGADEPDFGMLRAAADRYSLIDSSVSVRLLLMPALTDDRFDLINNFMDVMSPQLDVVNMDVTWTPQLAHHLADLDALGLRGASSGMLPVSDTLGVLDGTLRAVPWFLQVGVLYYRPDLLQAHGYAAPPATWQELEEMASAIQAAERAAGKPEFWGYVWQGERYEGLTVNIMEWLEAEGGGSIIEPHGAISISNPRSVAAVERARRWIGSISPPAVLSYTETEALADFIAGNAAFMRGWPAQWTLVSHMARATVLPENSGVLGGGTLAVSRYSPHQEEAARVVEFLTSPREQQVRAGQGGMPPASMSLLDDPSVTAALPYLIDIRTNLLDPALRPAATVGDLYAAVSRSTYEGVHAILTGFTPAGPGLERLATGLQFFTGYTLER